MKCPDYQKLISDRMDGRLSPVLEEKLEAHLKTCQGCRLYEEELNIIEREIKKLPDAEPEDLAGLEAILRDRLVRSATENRVRRKKSKFIRWAPVWAAGLFMIAAVIYLAFSIKSVEQNQNLDLASLMSFEDSYLTLSQTLSTDEGLREKYNEEILDSIYAEVQGQGLEGLDNQGDYEEQTINNNDDKDLLSENIGLPEGR
ncbi:MAG: zf-HC2 domain-containing protein [Candidatus Saccharicenans sp.]|nr:zf-HC2 domain-containing protein [Candidatus Saccharicenans sp.]